MLHFTLCGTRGVFQEDFHSELSELDVALIELYDPEQLIPATEIKSHQHVIHCD